MRLWQITFKTVCHGVHQDRVAKEEEDDVLDEFCESPWFGCCHDHSCHDLVDTQSTNWQDNSSIDDW